MSLVAEARRVEGQLARIVARQSALLQTEYGFLLGRFIDEATLARAHAIAVHWGVHPHEMMIANGWLEGEDYYRTLAERCGAPFKAKLPATEVAPTAMASPRQCLAEACSRNATAPAASFLRPTASGLTRFAQCWRGFRPITSRSPRPLR